MSDRGFRFTGRWLRPVPRRPTGAVGQAPSDLNREVWVCPPNLRNRTHPRAAATAGQMPVGPGLAPILVYWVAELGVTRQPFPARRFDVLLVRPGGSRRWAGMERHGPERRKYSRAHLAYVTRTGPTGDGPRRKIGGVDLVSLSRSLAYRRFLRMARQADFIGADSTIGGEAARAHNQ
jgi:hypothetical protein